MTINIPNALLQKIGLGIVALLLVGGSLGVYSLTKSNDNQQTSTAQSQTPSYQYVYLAEKCKTGITNYQKVSASIDTETEGVGSKALAEAASVKKSNEANTAALTDQFNYYQAQAASASEDYATLDTATKIVTNISKQVVQAQNDVNKRPAAILQEGQAEVGKLTASKKTVTDRLARLSACIDAVNRRQSFSVTEVSDIESFIAQSNTRP